MRLLYATNQSEEVTKYLEELGDAVARSPRLTNIAISLQIREGNTANAVELARIEVNVGRKTLMSYIVLGQALLAAKENSEAGETFRTATTLARRTCGPGRGCSASTSPWARMRTPRATCWRKLPRTSKHAEQELLPVYRSGSVADG